MTLADFYIKNPKSSILLGESGYGKSTQLKLFRKNLLGKKIPVCGTVRTLIPVYIPMGDVNKNWTRVDDFFLQNYVRNYFQESTEQQINNLFENKKYQYIFLLDAVNEVINREDIYDHLFNSIYAVLKYDTVHVIISSTWAGNEADILGHNAFREERFQNFAIYILQHLTESSVCEYLGTGKVSVLDYPYLGNPLFLKNFRQLYQSVDLEALNSKMKLLKEALKKQILNHRQLDLYKDITNDNLQQLYEKIYPFFGYFVTTSLMSESPDAKETTESLLEKYYEKCESRERDEIDGREKEIFKNRIQNLIDKQKVFDSNSLLFSHHYYLEYFAAHAFCSKEICYDRKNFIQNLIVQLKYKNRRDLIRRTRFLGLAEFIVSEVGDCLEDFVGVELAAEFYKEFAGVYDDLRNDYGTDAARYAFYSYRYSMNKELTPLTLNTINFLFYCMLKDVNYTYIYEGKEYTANSIANDFIRFLDMYKPAKDDDKKTKVLYGKVINNIGAYYFALKNFEKAFMWHKKALDYREKNQLSILDSCRCLMGDNYHLYKEKQEDTFIEDAYHYYRLGTKSVQVGQAVGTEFADTFPFIAGMTGDDSADYAARGLGIIAQLIYHKKRFDLADEALALGKYVLEEATKSRRIDRDNIKNVKASMKVISTLHFDGVEKFIELDKKCQQILF